MAKYHVVKKFIDKDTKKRMNPDPEKTVDYEGERAKTLEERGYIAPAKAPSKASGAATKSGGNKGTGKGTGDSGKEGGDKKE